MEPRKLPKGVYVSGKKYISRITYQGKAIHLGTFATPEEASKAYTDKQAELGVRSYKTTERVKKETILSEELEYQPSGVLKNKKTGKEYTSTTSAGYVNFVLNGQELISHRVIWELHNGPIPEGLVIDHINMVRNDNRIENLRLADRSQNNANCVGHGGKYPKGVTSRTSGRYQASIQINGQKETIGTFDTIEEAKAAYDKRAIELFGEFARIEECDE